MKLNLRLEEETVRWLLPLAEKNYLTSKQGKDLYDQIVSAFRELDKMRNNKWY